MNRLTRIALAVTALGSASMANAATYVASLQTPGIPAGLHIFKNNPAYVAYIDADGLSLSRSAGATNGNVGVASDFTFGGVYDLSVDVDFLFTGLSDLAEAGLAVTSQGSFSDVFGYNNDGSAHVNNFLGQSSLTLTSLGDGRNRLRIAGDTGIKDFSFELFLLQEYGGTARNTVRFTNLVLNADRISQVGGVPEPASWALMILGFGLVGGTLRAGAGRGRSRVAA